MIATTIGVGILGYICGYITKKKLKGKELEETDKANVAESQLLENLLFILTTEYDRWKKTNAPVEEYEILKTGLFICLDRFTFTEESSKTYSPMVFRKAPRFNPILTLSEKDVARVKHTLISVESEKLTASMFS